MGEYVRDWVISLYESYENIRDYINDPDTPLARYIRKTMWKIIDTRFGYILSIHDPDDEEDDNEEDDSLETL